MREIKFRAWDIDSLTMVYQNNEEYLIGYDGVEGKYGKALDTKLKQGLQRKYEELGLEGEELQYWLGGKFYL